MMHELIFTTSDISSIAQQIIMSQKNLEVITLSGTLGAGKTTLAIEILRQLGVQTEMQSPTYTYIQTYTNQNGKNLYHFDLYRLKNSDDFLFAGFDEFLYQPNSLTIIEWPEIILPLLERNVCIIQLDYIDDMTRKISWSSKS